MFTLIPPLRALSLVAISYAAVVVVVLFVWGLFSELTVWSSVRIAFAGALVLDVVLLAAVHIFWKKLWVAIPSLGALLFPDLNGRWKMKIDWVSADRCGTVEATATIKQTFLSISMEVQSEHSDSETLMAKPKKDPESGRPLLYYVYRVVPKQNHINAGPSYEGAAILKFELSDTTSLSGNYFTSQRTKGRFELRRE